jgi:hypothetical protein
MMELHGGFLIDQFSRPIPAAHVARNEYPRSIRGHVMARRHAMTAWNVAAVASKAKTRSVGDRRATLKPIFMAA